MAGIASGLEARVDELVDEGLERHAILQADRNGQREAVHEAGERRTFLGHLDEDFAGLAGFVHADGDVALVAADREFVRNGLALAGHLAAEGTHEKLALLGGWRSAQFSCGRRRFRSSR